MVNTHCDAWYSNPSTASPQRIIETIGRLQTHFVNTIPSNVYIYDLVDQRTLCSSCSVTTMLGYTANQIRSLEPLGLAALIHPDDLQRVSEHFQRFTTLREGQVIAVEYRMKRADGTWHCLRSQDTLLVQAIDGFPLQVLGMIQDITQQKREEGLGEAFSYLREHLSERLWQ